MQTNGTLLPAILLMGPTASGKSALAVKLAQRLNTEIISVDSALVYRGMNIGVAKPSVEERGGVMHHLLDILDPLESYSTGQFRQQALALMQEISSRGKIPLLVGGTMLYFNALLQGLAELPESDPQIRAELVRDFVVLGKEFMHRRLQSIDPESAARIHPNDPQRVQRALEVYMLSGQSLSNILRASQEPNSGFDMLKLVVAPKERSILHQKIAYRLDSMFKQGFVEEVEVLFRRGDLSALLPSMRAVGYRQLWEYLESKITLDEAKQRALFATRQLAKRQFTWLRKFQDAQFLDSEDLDLERNAFSIIQRACASDV